MNSVLRTVEAEAHADVRRVARGLLDVENVQLHPIRSRVEGSTILG
jgi:hypothetical protein